MLGPSSPASSVAAPAPAPTTTTPPMVAVYNIGVSSDTFRTHEKGADSSWRKLEQELETLYLKTGLVFIQEAGSVSEKSIAPQVLQTALEVSGNVISLISRNIVTRRRPKILEMHNAVCLCDPATWTIDKNAIRPVQTWGADGVIGTVIPAAELPKKAWRWHHLGNSIGIVRGGLVFFLKIRDLADTADG